MSVKQISINSAEEKSIFEYLKQITKNHELVIALVKKDLIVKTSKTLLGKMWLFVQPAVTILIYSIFFGQLLKIDSGKSPYPLFLISGLVVWNYFSQCTSIGGNLLVSNQEIIRKTPFPKIILNISSALYTFIEQFPFLLIILFLSVIYQKPSVLQLIFFPFTFFFTIILSLGVSNLLSNFSIKKRDLSYAYSFVLQVALWTTPVFYPVTLIPEKFLPLMYINPLVGILDVLRWSLNLQSIDNYYFIFSFIMTLVIFIMSIFFYKMSEKIIPDYI